MCIYFPCRLNFDLWSQSLTLPCISGGVTFEKSDTMEISRKPSPETWMMKRIENHHRFWDLPARKNQVEFKFFYILFEKIEWAVANCLLNKRTYGTHAKKMQTETTIVVGQSCPLERKKNGASLKCYSSFGTDWWRLRHWLMKIIQKGNTYVC